MQMSKNEKRLLFVVVMFFAMSLIVITIVRTVSLITDHSPQVTFGNTIEELFNVTDGDYVMFPNQDNSARRYTIVNMRDGREYSSDDSSGAWMVPIKNTDGSWSYNIKWLNHLDRINRK